MKTIDKIITKCDTRRGAPTGRPSVMVPNTFIKNIDGKPHVVGENFSQKLFDCKVPMCTDGAYDRGAAYWGLGKELRVAYSKNLTTIYFYRRGEEGDWRLGVVV